MLAWPAHHAQRRAAGYLLRALLGPLAPELDNAQIDAALLSGRLDVRRVRLDPVQLAQRLAIPHLVPTLAHVGGLQVFLPPLSQLWNGTAPIRIVLEQIRLEATLVRHGEDAADADGGQMAADELAASWAQGIENSLHQAEASESHPPAAAQATDDG